MNVVQHLNRSIYLNFKAFIETLLWQLRFNVRDGCENGTFTHLCNAFTNSLLGLVGIKCGLPFAGCVSGLLRS